MSVFVVFSSCFSLFFSFFRARVKFQASSSSWLNFLLFSVHHRQPLVPACESGMVCFIKKDGLATLLHSLNVV